MREGGKVEEGDEEEGRGDERRKRKTGRREVDQKCKGVIREEVVVRARKIHEAEQRKKR